MRQNRFCPNTVILAKHFLFVVTNEVIIKCSNVVRGPGT